jgi:DNA-binding MarR family transcriptional regulator
MTKLKTTFKKAEDSSGFMLWRASNLLQRLHNACLKNLDITTTQFSFMTCLVYLTQNGDVTSSQIVEFTGMDKMLVSDLVKSLEKKKFLLKIPHPEDGRSFFLEATEVGEKTVNQAVRKVEAVDREFFRKVKNLKNFHEDLLSLMKNEL